jgi:Protein of unknown function (DUF2971)
MKLFHLSPFEFAITNIALRRLKISRIGDLNDPFELLPIDLRDKKVRAAVRSTRLDIDKTTGMICFSSTWENPVLWSHYADKHRGIALGFELPENFVIPVTYADTLLNADIEAIMTAGDVDLTSDFVRTFLATKYADWKYENESRVFLRLDPATSEGGLFFAKFGPKLKLVEVVLGARCPTPIKRVRDLVKSYPYKVHVKRARIAFTKFCVVENRASREKV